MHLWGKKWFRWRELIKKKISRSRGECHKISPQKAANQLLNVTSGGFSNANIVVRVQQTTITPHPNIIRRTLVTGLGKLAPLTFYWGPSED